MKVTTEAIGSAKLQSNRHHQQTNTQHFDRPNLTPNQQCQSTEKSSLQLQVIIKIKVTPFLTHSVFAFLHWPLHLFTVTFSAKSACLCICLLRLENNYAVVITKFSISISS